MSLPGVEEGKGKKRSLQSFQMTNLVVEKQSWGDEFPGPVYVAAPAQCLEQWFCSEQRNRAWETRERKARPLGREEEIRGNTVDT